MMKSFFSSGTKTEYVCILVFDYTITLSDYCVTLKPKTNNLSKIMRMHLCCDTVAQEKFYNFVFLIFIKPQNKKHYRFKSTSNGR